ncbi:divergent polysaccharide deacetylase family protein [Sinisalibacter lacisalsi]|uniref:Divergent polysaccharide deacetylase family protein n=1 Tax=Sinisalibacter lacisalsi TaxID=1526570 RepID=A0ABQ1QP12_9RHOB|nr:divergent polysaccharide deacetylase family protein [Sinisalibacter lacisalsi]GGD33531.1 hypothetical protein GCM10011358_17020 [Sinisalibacter lacisalsi]
MARGILAGIATGIVVAGLGLGTASLVLDRVEMPGAVPAPAAQETPVNEAPEPAQGQDEAAPVEPEMPAAEDAEADGVPDAGGDAPADTSPADTPSDDPQEGDAEAEPDLSGTAAPAEAEPWADAGDTADADATNATAATDADTADAPDAMAASDAETPPADADEPRAPTPEADAPSATRPADAQTPEAEAQDDGAEAEAPAQAVSGAQDDAAPADADAPEAETDVAAAMTQPESPAAPAISESTAEMPGAPDTDAADAAEPAETTAEADPEADTPASTVITGRLPRIGDETEEEPTGEDLAEEATAEDLASAPALQRNAAPFDAPADLPLMAILLIDTGNANADLGNLPFPVSVAVDAAALDAAETIAFYRDQGLEVVTILPLPEGATAADVEINLEAYVPLLEDSVAAMAEESLGFQGLGPGAVQLAVNLAETGHGLVSFPSGLNTGHKAAQKAGVKAGLVFRDLDAEGQAAPVIRRFLDNAAFRARNESGVIVVARTRAETVQALVEWSLGTRAASVTLAPVSALLADR